VLDELKNELLDKRSRGVKQIRVTSVLAAIEAAEQAAPEDGRVLQQQEEIERLRDQLARRATRQAVPELVGSTEAAEILGVERPRISRWREKGVLPDPVAVLKAGPIWTRAQIEGFMTERERRTRVRRVDADVAAPSEREVDEPDALVAPVA
jgi:hypothetical protein